MKDLEFDLATFVKEHGLKNVLIAFGSMVFKVAETVVLDKNGGSRNSIDYRKWERAAIAIGNLEPVVDNLPEYPPYHS